MEMRPSRSIKHRTLGYAFGAAILFSSGAASAHACTAIATESSTEIYASLKDLLDKKQVEFVGYTARKLASLPQSNCYEKAMFWKMFYMAEGQLTKSEMVDWSSYKRSAYNPDIMTLDYSLETGKTSCTVRFNLPKAGFVVDPQVDCEQMGLNEQARKVLNTIVFAPQDVYKEFEPATDAKLTLDLNVVAVTHEKLGASEQLKGRGTGRRDSDY